MRTPARRPHSALALALCSALATTELAAQGESLRRYGEGTPGSDNVVPTLWVKAVPRPGDSTFRARVERGLGGTWAILFAGTAPNDLVFGGVRFLFDATSSIYLGSHFMPGSGGGSGATDINLPLPNNPELVNAVYYLQAFTLDDFAPNLLGFGATAGLVLRPARSPLLLAARALPSDADPQTAIDLRTGATVDFDTSQFVDGAGMTFVRHGSAALALDPATLRLRAFDCDTFPPTWSANSALLGDGIPSAIALTPDGSRVYVVHQGGAGEAPPIVAYGANAGASFGQPVGPPIRLEVVPDVRRVVFDPATRFACVAALGTGSGPDGSLRRVDVRLGSPTFHQETDRIDFPGMLATDVALSSDGKRAYVALVAVTRATEIAVIDTQLWQLVDMDPQAPGVQNLGGERSLPRLRLPLVLGRLLADPRNGELYGATLGAVVRVNADPESPHFRRITTITAGIPAQEEVNVLALDDAGARLYAATQTQVIEIDTTTLAAPRSWPLRNVVDLSVR